MIGWISFPLPPIAPTPPRINLFNTPHRAPTRSHAPRCVLMRFQQVLAPIFWLPSAPKMTLRYRSPLAPELTRLESRRKWRCCRRRRSTPEIALQDPAWEFAIDTRAGFGVAAGMRYFGGKNQSGVFQRIINLIPPHRVYVEPFLGSGAILRLKAPAEISFGVDRLLSELALHDRADVHLVEGCGIEFLESYSFVGDEFVYCDPPYLWETRRSRSRYRHELSTADHARLLRRLVALPCKVMISGYPSVLYDGFLSGWNCERFEVMTRGHTWATESLWFNFPRPSVLHDHSYVGENYRDRLRIKRKRDRWAARLARMPDLERQVLFSALVDAMRQPSSE
jgi:DNA adenine methylase